MQFGVILKENNLQRLYLTSISVLIAISMCWNVGLLLQVDKIQAQIDLYESQLASLDLVSGSPQPQALLHTQPGSHYADEHFISTDVSSDTGLELASIQADSDYSAWEPAPTRVRRDDGANRRHENNRGRTTSIAVSVNA